MREIVFDGANEFGYYSLKVDTQVETDYQVDLRNNATVQLVNCLFELVAAGGEPARNILKMYGVSARRPGKSDMDIEIPVVQFGIPMIGD